MNNLPSNIEPITMFKESDYPFKLDMYPEYAGDPEVTFEIWYGSKKVDSFLGSYNTGTKRITGTFESDKIKVMPPVTDYYILLDGEYKFGGKIKPQLGSGEPSNDAIQAQLSGDNIIVVEVPALDEINSAVGQVLNTLPIRVETFAEMIDQIEEDKPRFYTVLNDEYQASLPPFVAETNVPYMWDGQVLFEYNISPCDFQPEI